MANPVNDARQPALQPRLAYLLSIYPAISHTFFLNEIAGLRKLGFLIDTASVNRPELVAGPASVLEARERETTFYIKAMRTGAGPAVVAEDSVAAPRRCLSRSTRRCVARYLESQGRRVRIGLPGRSLLLGDWMRQRNQRHLHVHFGGPVATVGMLAALSWQLSYSMMIHGPDEFYDVEKFYLRRKVEAAQFVLCISDYCRSQVMKVSDPAHWEKLHVVRLGVDLEKFEPVALHKGDALEIICVGRLVAAKGHLILLGAFSDLRRQGYNVRLRLIGHGSERSAIETLIAREKLEDCVILEGALNHEATRQKLLQADIFVLASFAEGVPVALMEAMAMGIPCVSTFVAGIPELIRDGIDGLLVPPSSQPALASALAQLIVDTDLRSRFAVAGRRRVKELYDLEKNTRHLAQVLRSIWRTDATRVRMR